MSVSQEKTSAALRSHHQRVAVIIKQLRQPAGRGKLVKIFHGNSNSTRMQSYADRHVIDTSSLNHVLEVNTQEKYVLVEPSVHMDELVGATLAYGLVPPVVMEFPAITVGGGVEGGAAESSSFRYGAFHETTLEYEIILGDGSVERVSRTQKPDLFWGTAGSYGSLGIITLVKLRLVPAQSYVRVTYQRTTSYGDALERIRVVMDKPKGIDFVDGIVYSPHLGTIMTGTLVATAGGPLATFRKPSDDWFYLHAQKIVAKHDTYVEYIPLKDYLFRYDRGAFWMGRTAIRHLKLPFSRLVRRLFDRLLHTDIMYRFLHASELSQQLFIQDMFMPQDRVESFIKYITKKLDIWPLWLLPLHNSHRPLDMFGVSHPSAGYVVNVGVWGKAPTRSFAAFAKLNREVEEQLIKSQAHKILYAHSYYPREQFWQIYNHAHYQELREKYKAEGIFQDIYDKVTVAEQYKAPLGKVILKYVGHKFFGLRRPDRPL